MILSRSIRTASGFASKRLLIRGTATYEFRGFVDGPNAGLLRHLIHGVLRTVNLCLSSMPTYILEMQREEVTAGSNPFKVRAIATAIKTIHELDYPILDPRHVKNVGKSITRSVS